jgi:hypothetical protein
MTRRQRPPAQPAAANGEVTAGGRVLRVDFQRRSSPGPSMLRRPARYRGVSSRAALRLLVLDHEPAEPAGSAGLPKPEEALRLVATQTRPQAPRSRFARAVLPRDTDFFS